jgi:hypothetical protein
VTRPAAHFHRNTVTGGVESDTHTDPEADDADGHTHPPVFGPAFRRVARAALEPGGWIDCVAEPDSEYHRFTLYDAAGRAVLQGRALAGWADAPRAFDVHFETTEPPDAGP